MLWRFRRDCNDQQNQRKRTPNDDVMRVVNGHILCQNAKLLLHEVTFGRQQRVNRRCRSEALAEYHAGVDNREHQWEVHTLYILREVHRE